MAGKAGGAMTAAGGVTIAVELLPDDDGPAGGDPGLFGGGPSPAIDVAACSCGGGPRLAIDVAACSCGGPTSFEALVLGGTIGGFAAGGARCTAVSVGVLQILCASALALSTLFCKGTNCVSSSTASWSSSKSPECCEVAASLK
jgi:hypothetical protein